MSIIDEGFCRDIVPSSRHYIIVGIYIQLYWFTSRNILTVGIKSVILPIARDQTKLCHRSFHPVKTPKYQFL